ncbi:response regulator transcription factor [Clostridium lacusfryxellense]|uniref:response regulator transcription factor n=1 Tax=Clostridium lacusfryxellense TaxID=205328 RepID=UPI001C0C9E3B|nr:response regulator transcription factor [Clostridium lacusfryxellense]MBU3111951.1 response regulator transcription factor [Clostridium lacusfryxellense]
MNEKILVVDDEESILNVLTCALKRDGYCVEKAYDGQEALDMVKSFKPHIMILDLMLPVINGYEVCKILQDENIGIIMLTAKNDIVDKIVGLELGADDYLTKPFDLREVLARVKSLARRFKKTTDDRRNDNLIDIHGFNINKKLRTVSIKNLKKDFTQMEFDLLYLLLLNPNVVYSRERLLDIVWDMEYVGGTRTVDTHVQRIRKKLGHPYEQLIQTVHGVGYKGVDELFEDRD